MSEHVYECMFLLDSNKYAKDPGGVSGSLNTLVEECGGTVLVSRLWNEQRLAYPIEGHKKGTYWLSYFRLNGQRQPELNRKCQLHDVVLRQLVLKVDPRLADTLVAHAGGTVKTKEPAETTAETTAEATAEATAETTAETTAEAPAADA